MDVSINPYICPGCRKPSTGLGRHVGGSRNARIVWHCGDCNKEGNIEVIMSMSGAAYEKVRLKAVDAGGDVLGDYLMETHGHANLANLSRIEMATALMVFEDAFSKLMSDAIQKSMTP